MPSTRHLRAALPLSLALIALPYGGKASPAEPPAGEAGAGAS